MVCRAACAAVIWGRWAAAPGCRLWAAGAGPLGCLCCVAGPLPPAAALGRLWGQPWAGQSKAPGNRLPGASGPSVLGAGLCQRKQPCKGKAERQPHARVDYGPHNARNNPSGSDCPARASAVINQEHSPRAVARSSPAPSANASRGDSSWRLHHSPDAKAARSARASAISCRHAVTLSRKARQIAGIS